MHSKHISSKNISMTTKSKILNMRHLATQRSEEHSLFSSFKLDRLTDIITNDVYDRL